ncbi:MAG: hypothetical protein BGO70_12425 [Bacteroidetes bacterium 43-93]|jgi:hypothetical protein|nr:hypothetical protein [Bacteroidota bacterium]OJW98260.1 MAG: hypothetical protein BGO70_12425 [Bacteroidetes bacterium 43-93]
MSNANEVHRKIKEISSRVANPRPAVAILGVANELMINREQLMPFLRELQSLRLIKLEGTEALRLTLLGGAVKR